jgi:hypothetical protein
LFQFISSIYGLNYSSCDCLKFSSFTLISLPTIFGVILLILYVPTQWKWQVKSFFLTEKIYCGYNCLKFGRSTLISRSIICLICIYSFICLFSLEFMLVFYGLQYRWRLATLMKYSSRNMVPPLLLPNHFCFFHKCCSRFCLNLKLCFY